MSQIRLGHVHLKVRNLEKAIEFYRDIFGLLLVERVADHYAFLSGNEMHHTLVFRQVWITG